MVIGNRPEAGVLPTPGKRYWWLSIGRNAVPYLLFDNGWRALEFVVLKPYNELTVDSVRSGDAHPYSIRIAFAYWLPFYSI